MEKARFLLGLPPNGSICPTNERDKECHLVTTTFRRQAANVIVEKDVKLLQFL